ncbi:uncharacterized protein LOC117897890 [Drosophila subobscura]|uniref:uncharacterized protein LOC117897890 n=1 Tax=Drosophila subobscura TaxID=7241 RepID=UPI00155A06CE|nr:uncharacterized protein LOC117897890 [Drosophila subobscura]
MHPKTGVPVWKSKKNPRLQCVPDCGKKLPTVQEDPWLVSIFTSDVSLSNYTYKCNGLIISPWLVFVEKLCTEESNVMRYAIAEGNRWASFVRNEEHPYELHNVANTFHGQQETILQMVNPLILSASVRPICLPPIPGTGTMTYYTQLTRYITTLDNQKIYYLVNISLEFLKQMKLFEINAQRGPKEGLN